MLYQKLKRKKESHIRKERCLQTSLINDNINHVSSSVYVEICTIGLLSLILSFGLSAQAQTDSIPTTGFAAFDESGVFHPYKFNRHPVGEDEIKIEILYSGICHSGLHNVHGDWRKEEYPMVPGHEIAGRVVAVGKNVSKFKVGDYAGIGCIINSCHECDFCLNGQEHYCSESVSTYHDLFTDKICRCQIR